MSEPTGSEDFSFDLDLSSVGVPTEPPAENTTPVSQPDGTSQTPTEPSNSGEGGNPAWAPILEKVPASLHNILRPELETWDKGVQGRFQKIHSEYEPYKPYKTFIDQGVDAEYLQKAYQIGNTLDSDPVSFYQNLGNFLRSNGLIPADQELPGEQDPDENNEGEDDPRYKQLQEKFTSLEQQLAQRAEQEAEAQVRQAAEAQLNTDIKNLQDKVGQLSPMVLGNVLNRAFISHQQGKPVSLEQAYEAERKYMSEILKARQKNPAPKIPTPGGSAAPSSTVPDGGFKNDKDRRSAAAAFIAGLQEGNDS